MSDGLGNIFEAVAEGPGPRGPDMKVDVEVPRRELGAPAGFGVPVPTQMELDGRVVPRRLGPGERGGLVLLHLPKDFNDGAVLRLRGQGGEQEGGRPGDLLVTVRVTDPAAAPLWPWLLAVAAVLGAGGVWFALAP